MQLGISLTELAIRAGMSKAYLSLIETGTVANPPADDKLRTLEARLALPPGRLVTIAQLHRTPAAVREALTQLVRQAAHDSNPQAPRPLDAAFLSGLLHRVVDQAAGNVTSVSMRMIPVVNKVAAGYPSDFTDLSYPRGIADDYTPAPDPSDPDAFAARVFGDSMTPKYAPGDVVVFSPVAAVRDGDDCFVRFDDGTTTFKRVYSTLIKAARHVRLVARNPKYPPTELPIDRIAGVYRAVLVVRPASDED